MNTTTTPLCIGLMVVVAVAGCPEPGPVSPFGALCNAGDDCGAFMCRPDPVDLLQRCLPPRQPSEPGETCEAPLVARPQQGDRLVDELLFFGGAVSDTDTLCGAVGAPELVVRFTLAPRPGQDPSVPQGISIRAEGDVAVELRPAGCSEERVRFGCAAVGQTALVAELLPGDYDLVVDGTPAGLGGLDEVATRVIVDRIDCPTGALPFDAQRCLRRSDLPAMLAPRIEHTAHVLDDGSVVVAGGTDGIGVLDTIELFDPTKATWQFGELAGARAGHASVIIDDDLIAIGGSPFDTKVGFSQVTVTRLALPEAHGRVARSPENIGTLPTRTLAGLGADGRMLVLSTDLTERGIYLLDELAQRTCSSDTSCRAGERCVERVSGGGLCVCLQDRCSADRAVVRRGIGDNRVAVTEGGAMQVLGERVAVVTGLEGLPIGLIDFRSDTAVVVDIGGPRHRHAAIVALDDRRAWVIGGVDDDDAPVAAIIEVDTAFQTATTLPFSLPTPVARPRARILGDAIVIVGDDDLPLIIGFDGATRAAPLVQPRSGSVMVAGRDRLILLGGDDGDGPTRSVQQLELVARNAPAPLPLPGCVATPLPEDGVITGNTVVEDDSFRSVRCDPFIFPYGRDLLFTFSLDEPKSLRIVDLELGEDADAGAGYRFFLLRGDCAVYDELACGDGPETLPMFVPELPAGDYTLVVEYFAFDDIFNADITHGGSTFSARVLLGAPETCPLDDRDPDDDVIGGALALVSEDPTSSFVEAEGRLCAGDVDHVLLEHHGGFSRVGVFGAPAKDVVIRPAIVDEAASLAAGHLVASAAAGDPVEDIGDAPPGHFLVELSAADDSVDALGWLVQFSPGCEPDVGDSLVDGLDNRTPARAPTLTPNTSLERVLCTKSDVDVVILQPGDGADSFVELDTDTVDVGVFAIDGDALGAPVPFTVTPFGFDNLRLELGLLAGPVAVRLSVPAAEEDDVPELDVSVSYGQRQLGDSCRTPLPLNPQGERDAVVFFDTTVFNNDHDAELLGDCTGFRTPGLDIVLSVTLEAGETLDASLLGRDDADVGIYLLDRCPGGAEDPDACVIGADDGGGGTADGFSFTNETGAAATFFLVLDSFFGAVWTGDLTWSITGP